MGNFGEDYIARNNSDDFLASNLFLFGQVLSNFAKKPITCLELGANIGMNLKALNLLVPGCRYTGVEVNPTAFEELVRNGAEGYCSSIEDFETDLKYDLVFTKGVLIHLNPDSLLETYRKMASLSREYVMICEYFNPTPVGIDYRGHKDKLFKRDFAGEFLDANPGFDQISEGFISQRNIFSQDNVTWTLFRRTLN